MGLKIGEKRNINNTKVANVFRYIIFLLVFH